MVVVVNDVDLLLVVMVDVVDDADLNRKINDLRSLSHLNVTFKNFTQASQKLSFTSIDFPDLVEHGLGVCVLGLLLPLAGPCHMNGA